MFLSSGGFFSASHSSKRTPPIASARVPASVGGFVSDRAQELQVLLMLLLLGGGASRCHRLVALGCALRWDI